MSALLQNVGITPAQNETILVAEYIASRDLLSQLEENQNFRSAISNKEADFLQRFPRPFSGDSFEHMYKAYPRFVTLANDPTSGLSTLRVRAFAPEEATKIAQAILEYSEVFVNQMNDQVKQDSIREAIEEVEGAQARVTGIQEQQTAYRIETQVLDPTVSSGATLELIARLTLEASSTKASLAAMRRASPNNPQISSLRGRIRALEQQISAERKKVTGSTDSLALLLTEHERLALNRQFAETALVAANTALAASRIEARQKEVYLQRVAKPNLPDHPMYPRRVRSVFLFFLSTLILYGIIWLTNASVREHVSR